MKHAVALLGLLAAIATTPGQAAVFEVAQDGVMVRIDTLLVPKPAENASMSKHDQSARARFFQPVVAQASARYDLSPALVDAIARAESRYNPDAVSPANALGIMQLMPATARALGVDRRDPTANIRGGTAYLRLLLDRFDGDVIRTIAAYNAGPGAVLRAGGVPNYPETRAYVAAVLGRLAEAAQ